MGRKRAKFVIRIHGTTNFREVQCIDKDGLFAQDTRDENIFYERRDNRWYVFDLKAKPEPEKHRPVVLGDSIPVPNSGERPFGVNYGVKPTDENGSKIHTCVAIDEQIAQWQLLKDGKVHLVPLAKPLHGQEVFLSLSPDEPNRNRRHKSNGAKVRGRLPAQN